LDRGSKMTKLKDKKRIKAIQIEKELTKMINELDNLRYEKIATLNLEAHLLLSDIIHSLQKAQRKIGYLI
jgi:hypothetical protein